VALSQPRQIAYMAAFPTFPQSENSVFWRPQISPNVIKVCTLNVDKGVVLSLNIGLLRLWRASNFHDKCLSPTIALSCLNNFKSCNFHSTWVVRGGNLGPLFMSLLIYPTLHKVTYNPSWFNCNNL